MPADRVDEERPCLHCMMVELIDDFFADYPATAGPDKVDTTEADEVIDAVGTLPVCRAHVVSGNPTPLTTFIVAADIVLT